VSLWFKVRLEIDCVSFDSIVGREGLALETLSTLYPHLGQQDKELVEPLLEKIPSLLATGTEQADGSLVFKHLEGSGISNLKTTSKVIESISHFIRVVNKGSPLTDITNVRSSTH
jgi:hypothetical protein